MQGVFRFSGDAMKGAVESPHTASQTRSRKLSVELPASFLYEPELAVRPGKMASLFS